MKFVPHFILISLVSIYATGAPAADLKRVPEVIVWNDTAFSWPAGERSKFKTGDSILTWDIVEAKTQQTLAPADCARWSFTLNGAKWCFANEKNLATFKQATDEDGDNPFVPKYGGRCLLGTSWGVAAAPGDPRTFRLIADTLVLQSHNKWWSQYNDDRTTHEKLAALTMRIYRTLGVIEKNDTLKSDGADGQN